MKKNTRQKLVTCFLMLSLAVSLTQTVTASASDARLNKTHLIMRPGQKTKIKVQKTSGKVTWKTSNKKIASINQKGNVTAKKAGKAKITAKIKSKKLTCIVTVKKIKPIATQKPTSTTQIPAVTVKPAATKKPVVTARPVITWRPTITQNPVTTIKPVITTPAASPTQPPAVTQKPTITASPSDSTVTEQRAYNILNSLRSTYPEGMTLTNSYYYYSPQFGNGYGCYGFAAKLSDTVFGTATPYKTHSSFSSIKVADNIRIGNSHSVIVLTKSDNYITVVEGNYNSSVHWDRKITATSLASSGFTVYTRYGS